MALPELTALARFIDQSNPDDKDGQRYNLERLRELCAHVKTDEAKELTFCLKAAGLIIGSLTGPAKYLDRAAAKDLASRLLELVDRGFAQMKAEQEPDDEPLEPEDELHSDLPQINDMVLGQILIELACVTEAQVAEALDLQGVEKGRIGECLQRSGATTADRVAEALKLQERMRAKAAPPGQERERQWQGGPASEIRVTKDLFFGEVLLGAEMITSEQLEQAMRAHIDGGMLLGEALVALGYLTEADVERGLDLQRSLRRIPGLSSG